ncbi:MAG: hypothetical protein ABL867_04130 [Rickettsiales bacterium]
MVGYRTPLIKTVSWKEQGTSNQTVAAAYEGRLEELARSRNLIGEDIAYTSSVDMSFNGALRTVFDFIEKPYQLWCTGNEEDKKTTLKLVFAKRARHDLNDGFRTAAYSLPFLIMQQSVDNKSGVVELSGIRSNFESNFMPKFMEAMHWLNTVMHQGQENWKACQTMWAKQRVTKLTEI